MLIITAADDEARAVTWHATNDTKTATTTAFAAAACTAHAGQWLCAWLRVIITLAVALVWRLLLSPAVSLGALLCHLWHAAGASTDETGTAMHT